MKQSFYRFIFSIDIVLKVEISLNFENLQFLLNQLHYFWIIKTKEFFLIVIALNFW